MAFSYLFSVKGAPVNDLDEIFLSDSTKEQKIFPFQVSANLKRHLAKNAKKQ